VTTMLVGGKSYNVPAAGQTVKLLSCIHPARKTTVKVTAVTASKNQGGWVVVTGYRIYKSGSMGAVAHSYPTHVSMIEWS
jgi:hypothetical protein